MAMLRGKEWPPHHRHAIVPDASGSSRPFARLAMAALMLGWAVLGARPAFAQDDDWSVVSDQVQSTQVQPPRAHERRPSQGEPAAEQAPQQQSQRASADGARMICGEMARPAAEPYKSIVANIDREWGINAPVYESVRADSPHVSRGGCIFYNPVFIAVFLRGETDEHGEPDKTSMLYAIMAHELGHIVHHDYQRTGVSSVTKELEADRFSGYTLERMGIARENITPFYSLGGDEFSGVHDHGFSNQRIAAFDQGWKAAEWNRPEDDESAIESAGNKPAAAVSDETDDSSAAAAVP
jgi:hypothetical protein